MKDFLYNNFSNILTFCFTLLLTFVLVAVVRKLFTRFLNKIAENDELDKTNYYFLRYVIVALIYAVGFTLAMYSIPALRAIGTTLLAGAGVLALAVSFASQQALSNIVSGLFIVLFKPFKIGDRVFMKARTLEGVIEDITLRHTVIRDYENRRIIVPNSIISNEVITNADYGDGKICRHLLFGISYDSSIEKARNIIQEETEKHPLLIDDRTAMDKENGVPIVVVRVLNLGESSIDLKAFAWVNDQKDGAKLSSDLLETIKNRFDAEGIEIPYPHRKVVLKKEQQVLKDY